MATRTIFSVVEVTPDGKEPFLYIDWNPDLMDRLDDISPNGELTDKIIDLAASAVAGDVSHVPLAIQSVYGGVLMAAQGPNGKAAVIKVDDDGHVICSQK